jgi:hypothetical protein
MAHYTACADSIPIQIMNGKRSVEDSDEEIEPEKDG